MGVLAHGDDRAEEGQPHEQPARHLLRHRNAGVEGVAQHHVAENENHHDREEHRDQDLQKGKVAVHYPRHGCSSMAASCSSCWLTSDYIAAKCRSMRSGSGSSPVNKRKAPTAWK